MKKTAFDELSNIENNFVAEADEELLRAKQEKKKKTWKVLLRIASCAAAACAVAAVILFVDGRIKIHKATPVYAEELSADYQNTNDYRGTIPSGFYHALNEFSFDMLSKTVSEENLFESPFSLATALSMLLNGTDGNTKAQIENALGLTETDLNRAIYLYTRDRVDSSVFTIANSIWVNETLNVNPAFLQTNADWHSADIFKLPFNDTAVQDINKWCYGKTNGKIDHIIDKFGPNEVMELINAVYFKDTWEDKYKLENIKKDDFTNYDGTKKEVTYLCSDEFEYYYGDDFTGFSKWYDSGDYKFVALLPDEGVDIIDFVKNFTAEKWEQALEQSKVYTGKEYIVAVRIPEFEQECDLDLAGMLNQIGITDVFDPSKADLTRLDGTENAKPGSIYVSKVRQKTYIKLDKEGTEAAATTIIAVPGKSMPPNYENLEVFLNRPFVYMIIDSANEIPMFVGTVMNFE